MDARITESLETHPYVGLVLTMLASVAEDQTRARRRSAGYVMLDDNHDDLVSLGMAPSKHEGRSFGTGGGGAGAGGAADRTGAIN